MKYTKTQNKKQVKLEKNLTHVIKTESDSKALIIINKNSKQRHNQTESYL